MSNIDQYILILSGILSYIVKSLAVNFQELEQLLDEFLLGVFFYCFWRAIQSKIHKVCGGREKENLESHIFRLEVPSYILFKRKPILVQSMVQNL